MKKLVVRSSIVALCVASLTMLSACGTGQSGSSPSSPKESADASAPVSITVTGKPSDDQPDQLKVFNDRIAAFEKRHPNITVVGSDKNWDPQTFNAMLAAGTLPDLYVAYFTDSKSIVNNGQASDLTDALTSTGLLGQLNPSTLALAQNSAGRTYGIPFTAYGLGLVYNRELFTQAGLDPDKPPTTWDQVRQYSKVIAEKTGVPGFGTMTKGATGGWMLTAASFSFGGTMQKSDGTPTFDSDATGDYLRLLHSMRFDDKSIGDTVIYDQAGIGQALAAKKVAMFIGSPSSYSDAVITNGMVAKNFGMGPMPQNSGTHGTLTGGGVFMASPKATPNQKVAIATYVQEIYLNASLDKDAAVSAAKADFDQKLPVGLPSLSVFTKDTSDQVDKWIADYVNVPTANFATYKASLATLPMIVEPAVKAQDMYSLLSPVVQSTLTDRDADITALLSTAAKTFAAKLGR